MRKGVRDGMSWHEGWGRHGAEKPANARERHQKKRERRNELESVWGIGPPAVGSSVAD